MNKISIEEFYSYKNLYKCSKSEQFKSLNDFIFTNKNNLDILFSPLGKQYCLYFYIISLFTLIVLVLFLFSSIYIGIYTKKNFNKFITHNKRKIKIILVLLIFLFFQNYYKA